MRVIGYLRVSTDEQRDSGLGLAAQREAIQAEADRRGWQVHWIEDAGYSAKSLDRPGVQEALRLLNRREAQVLVVAKLDRLSRSLLDFAGVTEQAKRRGWSVVALDLGVDMTTPAGEMLANVLASFAQYERALISARTRDALAAAKARGQRLGRPRQTPDHVVARCVALRDDGLSTRQIAAALTAAAVPTTRGGTWRASTVRRVLAGHALDQLVAVNATDSRST
ncbi:MAG: recombinase family protein [Actinomycetota bacterium]|nr:recombinase family protein [Actinomycetota bacterium]